MNKNNNQYYNPGGNNNYYTPGGNNNYYNHGGNPYYQPYGNNNYYQAGGNQQYYQADPQKDGDDEEGMVNFNPLEWFLTFLHYWYLFVMSLDSFVLFARHDRHQRE